LIRRGERKEEKACENWANKQNQLTYNSGNNYGTLPPCHLFHMLSLSLTSFIHSYGTQYFGLSREIQSSNTNQVRG